MDFCDGYSDLLAYAVTWYMLFSPCWIKWLLMLSVKHPFQGWTLWKSQDIPQLELSLTLALKHQMPLDVWPLKWFYVSFRFICLWFFDSMFYILVLALVLWFSHNWAYRVMKTLGLLGKMLYTMPIIKGQSKERLDLLVIPWCWPFFYFCHLITIGGKVNCWHHMA